MVDLNFLVEVCETFLHYISRGIHLSVHLSVNLAGVDVDRRKKISEKCREFEN